MSSSVTTLHLLKCICTVIVSKLCMCVYQTDMCSMHMYVYLYAIILRLKIRVCVITGTIVHVTVKLLKKTDGENFGETSFLIEMDL